MILLGATDWEFFFFLLFALVACVFALGVLFSSNIVRMAFYLVLSLGATAGLFFLAGAEFLGAMQLMIYVGGTLVLLIFGVMLTAQSRFVEMKTKGSDWVLAIGVGGALFLMLANAALSVPAWQKGNDEAVQLEIDESKSAAALGAALVGVRVDKLSFDKDDPRRRGLSGYLLPFVIVSVHLLVVLIGAGYMARTKKLVDGRSPEQFERERSSKRRGFLFVALTWIGMLANAKLAYLHWLAQPTWRESREGWFEFFGLSDFYNANLADFFSNYVDVWVARSPNLMWILGWLFIANVVLLYITYHWQKWSVYALFMVPLIQVIVIANSGSVGLLGILGFLAVTVPPVAVYAFILRQGREPTVWSQLE